MQHPSEKPPQSQAVYQQPYGQPATAVRPGLLLLATRMIRLIIRRLLYLTLIITRVLRPHAGMVILGLVSLVIISWMGFQLWGPQPGEPNFARSASIAPAVAIENYLEGRKSYNAEMMWDAFSTSYQTALLNLGASKATLQSQADNERSAGLNYGRAQYIGGVATQSGGSMYFYSIDLSLQQQQITVPIIFTANADGKIEDILSPLSRVSSSSR